MRITAIGGEGKTAKDALKALAFSLKDSYVDANEKVTVTIERATISGFGDEPSYEGFEAKAVFERPTER